MFFEVFFAILLALIAKFNICETIESSNIYELILNGCNPYAPIGA